jgi:CRP-like cAMP-binding protein
MKPLLQKISRGESAMVEDETLRTLVNAEIFTGLTPDEVKIFYDASQRVTCEKPATVIEKDQVGAALYIILRGQFEVDLPLGVYVPQQIGSQVERRMTKVQLNTLNEGDCFGEYSLIDQQPTSASVIATQPGELIKITKPAFEAILETNDHVAKIIYGNILRILIRRLRKLNTDYNLFLLNYGV